jgi:hypothetical protein
LTPRVGVTEVFFSKAFGQHDIVDPGKRRGRIAFQQAEIEKLEKIGIGNLNVVFKKTLVAYRQFVGAVAVAAAGFHLGQFIRQVRTQGRARGRLRK